MLASEPLATLISELRPSQPATIEAFLTQLEPTRIVEARRGERIRVRNGMLNDGTGEIALMLLGAEVDLVEAGDRVRIIEGVVQEFQGQWQVSLGPTGRLEKLSSPEEDDEA